MQITLPTTDIAIGAALSGAASRPEAEPAVFITVQRFCHDRSLPRSSFYKAVKAGCIKPVKRGRRTLVHQDEAKRYDEALINAAA